MYYRQTQLTVAKVAAEKKFYSIPCGVGGGGRFVPSVVYHLLPPSNNALTHYKDEPLEFVALVKSWSHWSHKTYSSSFAKRLYRGIILVAVPSKSLSYVPSGEDK
jgi:hypothetical protein